METIKATVNKTHPKASGGYVLSLSKIRENQHFKCIRFDDVDFNECEAEEVIEFFANDSRRTWKEVHFSNCVGPVNAIITIILELNIVESLALTSTSIVPEQDGMSPLLAVGLMLPINTSLTSLAISRETVTGMGLLAEVKCLAFGLRRNTTLKTISLCDTVLHHKATLIALAKGFEKNKTLESVTLGFWYDPDNATRLMQALAENPSLRNVSTVHGPFADDAFADLLRSTQASIQSITYQGIISSNLLETIQNHCSTITSLNLRYCEIEDSAAILLAWILGNNSTPALEFLDLSLCELTETGCVAIASSLSTNYTLTKLVIMQTDIGDRGAQALAYALAENSSLQHLELAQNGLTEACITPFANALHQNSTLRVLGFHGNSLGDGVGQIFDALHHNSTLQELDISSNEISDAGTVALALAIASSLTNNWGLCSLDVSGNDIGTEGVRSIAEAMQANTTLKVLLLIPNDNESMGSPEILEGIQMETLRENCHLECFALCLQEADSREEILHTLNYNRGGRNILQDLTFPLPLWPMVLERADSIMYYRGEKSGRPEEIVADSERPQLSVLYSLLRGSPSLFSRPHSGNKRVQHQKQGSRHRYLLK
jgi:hypothetical protein